MNKFFAILLMGFIFFFSCAKDKTDDQKIQDYIAANNLKMQSTSEGVYYSIDSAGTGSVMPGATDIVYATYKFSLLDGTVISDLTNSSPDTFFLASTIAGLKIGLQKFTKGARGKIIVPSVLGFGGVSYTGIPANSVLVFNNIKVTDFESGDENVRIKKFLAQKGWTNYQKTPEGLYYVIDTIGTGTAMPTLSSSVTVIYKGYFFNGTVFDSNSDGATFKLNNVIQGWQIGIPLFKKGGKGKLIVPSSLGYGNQISGSIPANTPLVFEIELVSF